MTDRPENAKRSIYLQDKLEAIQSFYEFSRGEGLPKFPLEVYVEVSSLCNLRCAMCLDFSPLNRNRGHRSKSTSGQIRLEQILPQMTGALKHALYVHCSGNTGETTTHKDFPWMLDAFGRFEVAVDFLTNGMRLSDELVSILVSRSVYKVTVSFSGATASDYENMYIGASFKKVLDGLKRLQKAKEDAKSRYPLVEINSIGFKHHLEKLDQFVELMAGHGVSAIHVKPMAEFPEHMNQLYGHRAFIRPWVEGTAVVRAQEIAQSHGIHLYVAIETVEDENEYFRLTDLHRNRYAAEGSVPEIIPIERLKEVALVRQAESGNRNLPEPDTDTLSAKPDIAPGASIEAARQILNFLPLAQIEAMENPHCLQPFKTLYVCQSGLVKACNFAGGPPTLGDAKATDMQDIWNGVGFREIQKAILQGAYSEPMCSTCLKHRLGMTHHWVDHSLPNYLDWHISTYGAFSVADANRLLEQLGPLGSNRDIIARQPTT